MTMVTLRTTAPRPTERVKGERVRQSPEGIPTVSVIVLCYNYAHFLPQAVESVLTQRGVEVEVIVVDDASTDDSADVARTLAARDSRVRLVSNPQNLGMVGTFNNGLATATGEFLVRLDADDLLTPGSLARAAALFEAFPEVGLVYGHPVHFETPAPPAHRDRASSWEVLAGSEWVELRCRRGVNCVTSPEVLMRASVVDRVGGQRALGHTPDMELWMRIARDSDVGWIGGADQAFHREHPDSMSATGLDVMTDLHERLEAFEILLNDGIGDAAENARMLELARTALADEAVARTASAYARGRGGSAETEAYLEFARELGVDLDTLPHSRALRVALKAGPSRARFSPFLLASAASYRLAREAGRLQWRARGL
jgi:hypothetical protein